MKRLKSLIALLLVMALFSHTVLAVQFPDVDPNSTVGKAVDYLSNLGVLGGYEDGSFKPDATVTRAQFAKIVYMMENQGTTDPNADAYKGDSAFFDVSANQWFSGYVNWAYQRKIIGGMGDGTFAPDYTLTYAQAIKMYVVAAGVDDSGYSYPNDYITKATELGILNNVYYSSPNDGASRGYIAVMGYNKLVGGAPEQPDPPVQKPAAYRFCAQAPDFGAMYRVDYNYRSEDVDTLYYVYPQPGNYQQVGKAYEEALYAYGYSYVKNFVDSSGAVVNSYINEAGFIAMFSSTSEEVTTMVLFPNGQKCNPFVDPYYPEFPNLPNFGYYSEVPVDAVILEDGSGGSYYYNTAHPKFSVTKANNFMDILEDARFPYAGKTTVSGVEYRIFEAKNGFIALGIGRVGSETDFIVRVVFDSKAVSANGIDISLASREIAQQSENQLEAARRIYSNYKKNK